jgi:hypothetical protein
MTSPLTVFLGHASSRSSSWEGKSDGLGWLAGFNFLRLEDAYSCDCLPMSRPCLDHGGLSFLKARFPEPYG